MDAKTSITRKCQEIDYPKGHLRQDIGDPIGSF